MEDSQVRPDQFSKLTTPKFWNLQLERDFARIAMEEYPYESCAFIINNQLVPVKNISANPHSQFELSMEDSLLVLKAQGFIHSHPDGVLSPSTLDMISQKSANIPFGIVTCTHDSCSNAIWLHDGNLSIPLEFRPFIHGIFDCYSAVRAYMWQSRRVKLLDFPRENDWWNFKDNPDMYLRNFEKAGYRELKFDETIQEGDGILMSIQTNVVSHAAVYIGDGLILHHLRDRVCRKDHAAQWKKFFTKIVRYESS